MAFLDKIRNSIFLRRLAIILVFSAVIGTVFFPFLSGKKLINDYFALHFSYPFFKHFGDALKNSSQFGLLVSYAAGGFPAWLTQIGFFSPLGILLFKFFDYVIAYNWLIYFNFLLGGLAAYWLAKNLNLSDKSSIIVGLIYALSQSNLYWGASVVHSNTFLFLPLLFLVILKTSQGKRIYALWGSLLIGYGLLAGVTAIVLYALIAGFAWWFFLNWPDIKNYKPTFGLAGFIIMVILGGILASIWLVPVINYLPYTTRTGSTSIANLNYDFFIGDPIRYFYPFIELPATNKINLLASVANFYITVLGVFLALAAMIFLLKNKTVMFFFWLFLLTYIARIKFIPIVWFTNFIPILNRFRTIFHWHSVSVFALAVLAGFGLDHFDRIKESPGFTRFIKVLKIFALVNIILAALVSIAALFKSRLTALATRYFDSNIYNPGKKFTLDYYHTAIKEAVNSTFANLSLSNPRFLFPFIFVLVSAALLVLYAKGKFSFEKFKSAAVIVIILNLVLVFGNFYQAIPRSIFDNPPDTVKFLQSQMKPDEPFRVIRFYPPEMYQTFYVNTIKNMDDYDFKTLRPNAASYFSIEDAAGSDPFVAADIAKFLNRIGDDMDIYSEENKLVWIKDTDISLSEKIRHFASEDNRKLLGLLNVKYVFSSFEFPYPWKKVFQTTATERKIPIYIYENPDFLPRTYFVNSSGVADNLAQANLRQVSSQDIKIKTKNSKKELLIFSEMNLPTWLAYIDSKPTYLGVYNNIFMSLTVPAGEHLIEIKYPGLLDQFKLASAHLLN